MGKVYIQTSHSSHSPSLDIYTHPYPPAWGVTHTRQRSLRPSPSSAFDIKAFSAACQQLGAMGFSNKETLD